MQDYGPIFKEFRINRGFSLKQVACDDLSISQLSRFERGESDISLNKFLLALQAIQLSLDEFMNRANNYKKLGQKNLMSQMAVYHYQKDVQGLEKMIQEEQKKLEKDFTDIQAKLNIILFRGMICQCDETRTMSKEDLDFVIDYLFQKENWEIGDLILIGNFYTFYPTPLMSRMVREILKRVDYYSEISTNRNLVECTLINMIEICTERGELEEASFFEKEAEKLLSNERNAYHRTVFLYEKGFLKYAKGDFSGIDDMKNAIFCFEVTGAINHAKHYQSHMEKVLK